MARKRVTKSAGPIQEAVLVPQRVAARSGTTSLRYVNIRRGYEV